MTLMVFDMGQRVETPVRPEKTRIHPTEASQAITPVAQQHGEYGKQSLPYEQPSHPQHLPQPVAYVADIMQKQVRWIDSAANIHRAWQIMQQSGYHHLPVVDVNLCVCAILSDRDLLDSATKQQLDWQNSVLDYASRPVLCIAEEADIRQCARVLLDYSIGALPVVNQQNVLSGIVTRSDILQVISHYGPMELWA